MTDAPTPGHHTAVESAVRWEAVPPPPVVAELQNLLQAYALLTDEGREAELAALFWPDAVWDGRELHYGIATGPESIAKLVLAHFDPARPIIHMPGPPLLTATPDGDVEGILLVPGDPAGRRPDRSDDLLLLSRPAAMRCPGSLALRAPLPATALSRCGSSRPTP